MAARVARGALLGGGRSGRDPANVVATGGAMRTALGMETFTAVVRVAGGASVVGKGRPCKVARKRGRSSATGGVSGLRKMAGGCARPTGFMVNPVDRGAINGGAGRILNSERCAMEERPAERRPDCLRKSANWFVAAKTCAPPASILSLPAEAICAES